MTGQDLWPIVAVFLVLAAVNNLRLHLFFASLRRQAREEQNED